MAQMLRKPVFALPGCQRTSVNTLLCDTLGLADVRPIRTNHSNFRFARITRFARFSCESIRANHVTNRKRQFVHKISVHNFCAPWPPPSNQQNDGFPLEFLLKGPQTELRALSQNYEQTLQKLRTTELRTNGRFWTKSESNFGRFLARLADFSWVFASKTQESFSKLKVAEDVWEKDVWEFQAKSGSSGSCRLFFHFLGKIAVQEMSGKTPGNPRHPSSRHPWPSETQGGRKNTHGYGKTT